jgi:hypothetical protein
MIHEHDTTINNITTLPPWYIPSLRGIEGATVGLGAHETVAGSADVAVAAAEHAIAHYELGFLLVPA